MATEQHSAEKDLLRLIENPGEIESKKTGQAGGGQAAKASSKKMSLLDFSKRFKGNGAKKSFDLKAVFKGRKVVLQILFLATLGVFGYFVVTVVREYTKVKDTKNLAKFTKFTYIAEGKVANNAQIPGQDLGSAENAPEPNTDNLRNIFQRGAVKKDEPKKDDVSVILSDYRLAGISIAPDSKETYAMVKNVKTNITFFLKQGEQLDGMQLLNIFDNKLVLKVRGKDVELR